MAFLGNIQVTKNFDASEDLAKVAKAPNNILKGRIVSEIGDEDSSDIAPGILDGIHEKVDKFCKNYQGVVGGVLDGIGGGIVSGIIDSGIGDEDSSDVAPGILDGIFGKVVTEDFGEIVAFLGNAPVTKNRNFDAFEDLAKVAKVPYNALKERLVSAFGVEDSNDVAREILNGILAKIVDKDLSEIVDADEDLVKFYKKYQGVVGGFGIGIGSGIIGSGMGDEDISDVAREILDEILGKVVTEDFCDIVNAKSNRIKLENSTDIVEFKVVEENENVKNTNIRYRSKLLLFRHRVNNINEIG